MKTHKKIPIVCFQLLLVLALLLGTQTTVKASQGEEGYAAYKAGNYQKALEKFRPLAKQGNAAAQHSLAVLYHFGQGVPQDDKEAVKWYRKAAEQGLSLAQHNLGFMYDKGRGVPQDYKEAVKWYRKAAEQGESLAQFKLGFMYSRGRGVPQDYKEAVKWYRKAAEQGVAQAQVNLGSMYFNGRGVPQDYVQAHKWFNLFASSSKDKDAARVRDLVQNIMTPAQVAEAQKLASEWKPKTWKELSQKN